MGIEPEEVAECLDGDDGAGNGIILRNGLLQKDLQRLPGATAEGGKKFSVIEEVSTQNLRDAKDKMSMGYLFEDIHTEPLAEFHHALLVAGWAEVAALAGECQKVFVAAVFAFHTGKTVVQIAAIQVTINYLFDIRTPEAVLP